MRYFSGCSGIEAATAAWHPLNWKPVAFSEIEAFPSAVLAHHYPDVPNLGDLTQVDADKLGRVDVFVAGTPCQGFSIAGLRKGLGDQRNLTYHFVRIAHALAANGSLRWAVWENVDGVLSMPDNAFGCLLGGLVGADAPLRSPLERGRWPDAGMVAGPRSRVAWRVLDAQHFRLAQRRKRVFLVAGFGEGCDPAQVLFERKGLSGDPAKGRKAREDIAGASFSRTAEGGGLGTDISHALTAARGKACSHDPSMETFIPVAFGGNNTSGPIDIATALNAHGGTHGRLDFESETFIAHALRAEGFDASEDGTGRGTSIIPVAFSCKDYGADAGNLAPTLRAMNFNESHANAGGQVAVAYRTTGNDGCYELGQTAGCLNTATDPNAQVLVEEAVAFQSSQSGVRTGGTHATLDANNGSRRHNGVMDGLAVRRLTPRECERLQGFATITRKSPGAESLRISVPTGIDTGRWEIRWPYP